MMNGYFQFSKETQRAKNQETMIVVGDTQTKDDDNRIGNPTKIGITPLHHSHTDNTTTNKQDETPSMKVIVTGTKGNVSSSSTGGMAEEHVGLNKVINKEAVKDHSPFELLGVGGGSRANSPDCVIVIVILMLLLSLLLFSVLFVLLGVWNCI